jgi:hypothetical protein
MTNPIQVIVDQPMLKLMDAICKQNHEKIGEGRAWIIMDKDHNIGAIRVQVPPRVEKAFYILYDSGKSLGGFSEGPAGCNSQQFNALVEALWRKSGAN